MHRMVIVSVILFCTPFVYADIMNLNELMPTHLEDATPIQASTFRAQYSYSYENDKGHESNHRPSLRYGVSENIQLETQGSFEKNSAKRVRNNLGIGVLYRFNKSRNAFPEIALSPMLTHPTDGSSKRIDSSAKLILTSTLKGTSEKPLIQGHFNVNGQHRKLLNSEERMDNLTIVTGFSAVLTQKLAIVFDHWWDNQNKDQNLQMLEVGGHFDLSKEFYGSLGFGKGISKFSPKLLTMVGVEKQF